MASHSLRMQDEAEDLSLRAQLLQKQCEILQLQANLAQADAAGRRAQELARGASQALEHARHSLQERQRSLVVPDLPLEVMRDLELAILSLKTGLEAAAPEQREASPPPPARDRDTEDEPEDGCCNAASQCDGTERQQGRLSHLPTASACSTRPPTAGTYRVSSCCSSRPQSAVGVSSCCSPAQSRPQSAVGVSSCCSPAQSRPQSAVAAAGSRPQSAAAVRPSSARPRSAVERRSARFERKTGAPTFEELEPQRAARLRRLDTGFILKDLRARLKEDRESREKKLYMLTSRPDLAMVEHPPFFRDDDEQLVRSPTLLERVEASNLPRRSTTFRHRLAKYTNTALVAKVFMDVTQCNN
eukprot:TRINITY_DN15127_c0_g1_i2.p1 TRINITY_DN15127_c0_g1~~TRINITY_DN15127_c0_g1_i2.p1  ORF type:complete len:358 (-),score=82.92 TRINITY_DN15127_c0_g1_i2:85-1158(-)